MLTSKAFLDGIKGALQIIDGKAKIVSENYCDGLGACIGECPEGALKIEEREAYKFDEDAVNEYLESKIQSKSVIDNDNNEQRVQCSCPSAAPMVFETPWEDLESSDEIKSALRQWPTKLRLVNPNASYFDNKELLIVSDCSPIAFGDFHRQILRGKPIITICPMLNLGSQELVKLEEILAKNPIDKITLVLMEVPCCQKIKFLIDPILENLEREIIVEEIIISKDGKLLD